MERYFEYWGKADKATGAFHLAAFHCLDVAAVLERWLERDPQLQRKLGLLSGWAEEDVAPTVACFAALHDFGKFDVRFQVKAPGPASTLDPARAGVPATEYDHGSWGYQQLRDLAAEFPSAQETLPLLQAVCAHHGSLPSNRPDYAHPAYARFSAVDRKARRAWLGDVIKLFRARGARLSLRDPPSMALVELLAGACSVADWVGSQPEHFPFRPEPDSLSAYYDAARAQADGALTAAGLISGEPLDRTFADLFPAYEPRGIQRLVTDLDLPPGPCLVILEDQMGAGKTEAAFALAARFLGRGDARHVFIGLPTMATSNAMLARTEHFASRMYAGEANLLLAHGRSRTNPAFQQIVQRRLSALATGYENEAAVVCARWFLSRKRALLGQVGVGTVDQAMQAVLRVRHHFVRALGLSRAVVVIDEVHAYDAYMEAILERLLAWLGALRCPVVLLSATLPAARRAALGQAYASGPSGALADAPTAQAAAYPLVTVRWAGGETTHALTEAGPERHVHVERVASTEHEGLIRRLVEAAQSGGMVAWVRNTVTEAQQAFKAVSSAGVEAVLFHARFRGNDRQRIEDRVLRLFGKEGTRKGAILIATQVVEQSLDLDFDLLATDLAPIDLVLQRAGRLHRHQRELRPEGLERPTLVLVQPPQEQVEALSFGPSRHIYDLVTLWLSQDSLRAKDVLRVPQDIRRLVEDSYHPDARQRRIAVAQNAALLLPAEVGLNRELEGRQARALTACIPPAELDPAAFACFGDDDEMLRALTREGESATLLLVLWDGESGTSIDGDGEWASAPDACGAWAMAGRLLEEIVAVPVFPWRRIQAGVTSQDSPGWAVWEQRMQRFLEDAGIKAVLVPVAKSGDTFVGRVETGRGLLELVYTKDLGLRFGREAN